MVVYKIVYTKDSIKDIEKLKGANLNKKVLALIEIIKNNPFQTPPPYEKLVGDLQGLYSRRINIKHRLVYQILENVQTVKIISMWTHYEKI
ncbi:MAG: Txe/YoeB family addiction module toxin [Clostridia bacterium]|jgi:toxin YoeB|nr:Txe/YoeB family addiction module toxin [Clostridia bacterium]